MCRVHCLGYQNALHRPARRGINSDGESRPPEADKLRAAPATLFRVGEKSLREVDLRVRELLKLLNAEYPYRKAAKTRSSAKKCDFFEDRLDDIRTIFRLRPRSKLALN
jgi:hypothetical protein